MPSDYCICNVSAKENIESKFPSKGSFCSLRLYTKHGLFLIVAKCLTFQSQLEEVGVSTNSTNTAVHMTIGDRVWKRVWWSPRPQPYALNMYTSMTDLGTSLPVPTLIYCVQHSVWMSLSPFATDVNELDTGPKLALSNQLLPLAERKE